MGKQEYDECGPSIVHRKCFQAISFTTLSHHNVEKGPILHQHGFKNIPTDVLTTYNLHTFQNWKFYQITLYTTHFGCWLSTISVIIIPNLAKINQTSSFNF